MADDKLQAYKPPLPPRTKSTPDAAPPYSESNQHATISVDVPQGDEAVRYQDQDKLMHPPETLTRPLSAPPDSVPYIEVETNGPEYAAHGADLTKLSSATPSSASSSHEHLDEDEKKSGFAKRFFGNMLVARVGRAGVQSVASTIKLPMYLSPWGSNEPWSLPNLRKRDLALAGIAHFGADALVDGSLDAVETVVSHGASWTAERTADEGLERFGGVKAHKITRRVGATTIEIRIKHKLIGEHAEMTLFEERDSKHKFSCAKGWFCPYLYASSREPEISRLKDFSMIEFHGPGLKGSGAADALLAPTLLGCITKEDAPLVKLCSPDMPPPSPIGYRRMAVMFLGISPYRTAHTWSQARVPNQAALRVHMLTHIPALVFPVRTTAPVCAWSPWTMKQAIEKKDDYNRQSHQAEMMRYIETLIDTDLVSTAVDIPWRDQAGQVLNQIIDGILNMPDTDPSIKKEFDSERAGVVMFRF